MRYLKILFLSMVLVGLITLPAISATLKNSQNLTFGTGLNVSQSYKIAYELYNEAAGVSTIADRGEIRITLAQPLSMGQTANLVITSGNAFFNSGGALYKWGLWFDDTDDIVEPGEIIGYTPSAGLTTDNIPFSITQDVLPGSILRVIQWEDSNNNNDYTAGEQVIMGAGLYVKPGIGATCTNNPMIKVAFTTPHETSPLYNFAYITPQYNVTGPATTTMDAELDTDQDFISFIDASGPYVVDPDEIDHPAFLNIVDGAAIDPMWIAYVSVSPKGTISFRVNTPVAEDGVSMRFDSISCPPSADKKVFSCSTGVVTLVGPHIFEVDLDSITSKEPTNWTLSNFGVTVTTGGIRGLCLPNLDRGLGTWVGGLEVLVPFVKGAADRSWATYIVLYNRYNKDAKVYATTFKDSGSGKIMTTTSQITGKESIPAGGKLVITDEDIKNFLVGKGISWNQEDGIPVKFNIRVPSQMGTKNFTGTATPGVHFWPLQVQGTLTQLNPNDPFVEGIVISTFPGGGQRAVPLKFKTFKQGEYGH